MALLIILTYSCTHDPFPPPPTTMNNDTVQEGKPCNPDTVYYQREIQPILNANCAYSGCHDAATSTDGVNLSSYSSVISTADVRPFDADGSDLYEVLVETDVDKRMPFGMPPLTDTQIELIRKWILQGALNLDCDDCNVVNLTYNSDIKAIFDDNCVSCHGSVNPQKGRSLTNYAEVQDAILNTNLLQRINAESGLPVMPQGGKMPQCNIDKIEAWVKDGLPQ